MLNLFLIRIYVSTYLNIYKVRIYINTSVLSYFGANLIFIIHTAKKNYTNFIFVYDFMYLNIY